MRSTLHRFARRLLGERGHAAELPPAFRQLEERTRFSDVRRRIAIYQRALWGCDFATRSAVLGTGSRPAHKPRVGLLSIYLPSAYHDCILNEVTFISGLEIYRAAAAHAAAHIVYSQEPFSAEGLNKWQRAVVSVIEDARVESLAMRRFPGLRQLWAKQHMATPLYGATALDYLNRLARALLDENYIDDDSWIEQGRKLFRAVTDMETNLISREIGLKLAQSFSGRGIKFKERQDALAALYRDDNRYLWGRSKYDEDGEPPPPVSRFKHKGLFFAKEAVKDENMNDVADTKPRKGETRYVVSEPYSYPEWDFRSQRETPSWVTLREMSSKSGDLRLVENIMDQHSDLISRMKVLLDAMKLGGMQRIRKVEVGDELDVNAAIRALIDVRQGVQPDLRIMTRAARKGRDISVLVLLDLSKSTNEMVRGQNHTVLQLTQQICALFADAIDKVGDPFAIHGFCSNTRHFVEYFRLKDFDQAYDEVPKAKIAGMTGQKSTRMGAAVRHATHLLGQQPSGKKLLMVITDGEPSDEDVHDRRYLRYDTKRAIEMAGRNGIHTYCIGLDPDADQYVSAIFGANNYMVVDHVKCVPEKMIELYAQLTR